MQETHNRSTEVDVKAFMQEHKADLLRENRQVVLQNEEGKTLGQMYADLGLADKQINGIPFETFIYALNGFELKDRDRIPSSLTIPEVLMDYKRELSELQSEVLDAVLVTPNTYFVQPGDSGITILARYNISPKNPEFRNALRCLRLVNKIEDWTKIQPGQQLYIPEAVRTGNLENLTPALIHLVQPGETAYGILQNFGLSQGTQDYQKALTELEKLNKIEDWTDLSVNTELLIPNWIVSYKPTVSPINPSRGKKEPATREVSRPKGRETLQLSNGTTLEREGPLYFYVVQEGDTLESIVSKLSKQPRFSHLPEALERKIVGFNIDSKNLHPGMRLPLPIAAKERIIEPSEMTKAAAEAVLEIKTHPIYGPIVSVMESKRGSGALVKSLVSIAQQESNLGKVALHRYEPAKHHQIFSFGYHHILMSPTGLKACERLGVAPGETCDPKISSMVFLADLIEKAASRNNTLDPDKNYEAWQNHVLKYVSGIMPFTDKESSEQFASFYNGNWQRWNPNYPANILKYLQLGDSGIQENESSEERIDFYTLQSGDTFYSIAQKHKISANVLQALNPDLDPRKLRVGQKIRIQTLDPSTAELLQIPQQEKITTHARAIEWREFWKAHGIYLTSSVEGEEEDGLEDGPGRTYIPGVQERTMLGFLELVQGAPKVSNVMVNGIAESYGHAPGKTPQSHSHKNGFKIDFLTREKDGAALAEFIKKLDPNPRASNHGNIYEFKYGGYEYRVIMGGSGHETHADVAVIGPEKLTPAFLAQNNYFQN